MNKEVLDLMPRIKELHESGENIIQYFKDQDGRVLNSIQDILISYDFQSGSYIKGIEKNKEYSNAYTKLLADVINDLGIFENIIEVGVGEATTLGNVIPKTNNIVNPLTIASLKPIAEVSKPYFSHD
jgi:hypothetical protein